MSNKIVRRSPRMLDALIRNSALADCASALGDDNARLAQKSARAMTLRVEVPANMMLPRGYGVAYRNYYRDTAICYIMPLHIVVAVMRQAWIWLRHGYVSKGMQVQEAYNQGFDDGCKAMLADVRLQHSTHDDCGRRADGVRQADQAR